jgi:hypothetical protein
MCVGALLLAFAAVSVRAQDGVGRVDDGGNLQSYLAEVARLNARGLEKRIAGRCASACTAYLGVRRACVEPSAEVWFHGAYDPRTGRPDPSGSLQLLAAYPPSVRSWAIRVGALETIDWRVEHMLTAPELTRLGVPRCKPSRPGRP